MAGTEATCRSCGFANPRIWRACARCGRTLAVATKDASSRPDGVAPKDRESEARDEDTLVTPAPRMGGPRSTPPPPGGDGAPLRMEETVVDVPAPMADLEAPLIGQVEGAAVVRDGIERAFTLGLPTLVALEGERGAGKTRMLIYASEFAARIAPNVRILYAACREGGDGAYAPLARLLLDRFGVTPSSAPSIVRGQMATVVSEALGTTEAIPVAETTHLLGHIAGVPFPDSPFLVPLEANPGELRRRAQGAFRRLIQGDAQKRPVLILLDNMHAAEDDAWELLQSLVSGDGHISVVIAGGAPTAERALRVPAQGGIATGPIARFHEEDVAAMLLVLLPTLSSTPEPLVSAVTHRSKGNPAEIRELVFSLMDAGLFRETDDGLDADLAMLSSGRMPVTAEDAVRARLAKLDAFDRATLDRATVVGHVFWSGAVLAQMRGERDAPGQTADPSSLWPDDDDENALLASLTRLEERGFIERAGASDLAGTREYVFVHAATRTLVYDEMNAELRTKRHATTARFLAVRAELSREGVAAMIAPHLERAGLHARAGRAYLEAAAYERAKLRTSAALRFVEKALPLIDAHDVARRVDAFHEHGVLLTTLGRYDEARDAFTSMLRMAWQLGAPNKGGAALNRLARIERQRGADENALRLLQRALALFRRAGDLRGVASTLDDLAQIQRLRGEREAALNGAREALQIRRAHTDRRGEAVSLYTLGTIEIGSGHFATGEAYLQDALEIRQEINDVEGITQCQSALGILAYERGERRNAISAWRDALMHARETGDRRAQAFLLNNVGEALTAEKEYGEASEALAEAGELANALSDLRAQAEIERNIGILALSRGDDEAAKILEHALLLAEEYGAPEAKALAHRAVGQLRARTLFGADGGVDKRAEESFSESIRIFRDIGNQKEHARSLAELGRHLVERGDIPGARERLTEAATLMRKVGLPEAPQLEQTLRDLR